MSFQVKDFTSIVASMINYMRGTQTKVTDFNVGSVARTLVEAPAIEIEELYQQMFSGLTDAIPVAIYNSFGFARIAAVPASGVVRVTVTSSASALLIPAGTAFTAPSLTGRYTSVDDVVVAAGGTFADIYVVSDTAGGATNIAAGVAFSLVPAPAGFVSAVNAVAFINGADEETDDQRKWRFGDYIASLNHGTLAALTYGFKTAALTDSNGLVTEAVKLVKLREPYLTDSNQPVGYVQAYVHNGVSGATTALLAQAANVINGYYDASGKAVPGWKAAGVKVDIASAAAVNVGVTATLTALPGYTAASLITDVTAALQAYVLSLDIGVTAVRAELIAKAMEVDGVYNFAMTVPAADTAATYAQKCMPCTITIAAA